MTDRAELRKDSPNFHYMLKGKIEIDGKIADQDLFASPEQHNGSSLEFAMGSRKSSREDQAG